MRKCNRTPTIAGVKGPAYYQDADGKVRRLTRSALLSGELAQDAKVFYGAQRPPTAHEAASGSGAHSVTTVAAAAAGLRSGGRAQTAPRSAEEAAVGAGGDAGRVAPRGVDLVASVAAEQRQFFDLQYTLGPEELAHVPAGRRVLREIIHRQGFDAPAQTIDADIFEELARSGKHRTVYRGVFGGEGGGEAREFAGDLVEGDLYVGGGRYGDGIYLADAPQYALSYAAGMGRAPGRGAVVRFLVPDDARLAEFPFAPELTAAFEESGLRTMNEFLAASGYDGVRVTSGDGESVLFNRGLLLTDGPRAVPEEVTYLLNLPDRWSEMVSLIYPDA